MKESSRAGQVSSHRAAQVDNLERLGFRRFVARLAVAASGISAAISLVIQCVTTPARTVFARAGRAMLMGGPLLIVGLTQWLSGDSSDALLLGGLGLTVLLLGLFAYCEKRDVFVGSVVALCCLMVIAAATYYADVFRWHAAGPAELPLAASVFTRHELLVGRPNLGLSGYRGWRLTSASGPHTLSIDLAAASRIPLVSWMGANNGGPAWRELEAGSGPPLVEIDFTAPEQFVYRAVFVPNESSFDTLRGAIYLRSSTGEHECGHIALGRHEARSFEHANFCLDGDWARLTVEYAPALSTGSRQFDLVVGGFAGPVQARGAEILGLTSDGAVDLGPMMPTGATLKTSWGTRFPWERADNQEWLTTALPTADGWHLEATLPDGLPAGTRVWSSLYLEEGVSAKVLSAQWTRGEARPVANISRLAMGYAHPNLLGHSVAAIGVAAIITAPTLVAAALPLGLSGFLVLLTGSRAALATVLVILVAWVGGKVSRKLWRRSGITGRISVASLLVCATLLAGFGLFRLGADVRWSPVDVGANDPSGASERLAIWRLALSEIARAPLSGAEGTFAEAWTAAHPGEAPVLHAHNGLLDLGVRAGLPGVLAGLVPLILVISSPVGGRARAVLAVLALLLLNGLDATYMVPTVLAPLAFAAFASWRNHRVASSGLAELEPREQPRCR